MLEHMPIEGLDGFVAAEHHPMAPNGFAAAVAINEVAEQLGAYRRENDLTQREVADKAYWSPAKVLRIENGQVRPSVVHVRALLRIYGVTDDAEVAPLLAKVQASRSHKTHAYTGLPPTASVRYAEYEGAAKDGVWLHEGTFLPDFMQTAAYATAVDKIMRPEKDPAITALRMRLRRERAAHLLGKHGPPLRIILGEEALLRPGGDEKSPDSERYTQLSIMIEGVKQLNTAVRQLPPDSELNPDIRIQVATFRSGVPAILPQSCGILHVPGQAPGVYMYNSHASAFTPNNSEKGQRYARQFDQLATHIPGPDETTDILDSVLDQLARPSQYKKLAAYAVDACTR